MSDNSRSVKQGNESNERWCDMCGRSNADVPLTFGHGGFLALCAECSIAPEPDQPTGSEGAS